MIESLQGLENLHFIRPWWLLGALPALLLAILWARHRISASHWESAIEPELLSALLEPGGKGGFRKLAWLVAGSLALTAAALAGPSWERLPQPVEQKNDALVIVFDLSLSMFGTDLQPNRLTRARQKITDILRERNEGFTALVVYAGDAHIVAPLTDDVRTIENLLASLSPEMMPVLGSNLGSALQQAATLFENARISQGRTLVVTDSVDDVGGARDFCSRTFPLSILGVGTAQGSVIPLDFVNQPGQVLRSQGGAAIVAKLNPSRLRDLADSCFGRYRTLELKDEDIAALLATPLPQDDESVEVEREFDTWSDMGFAICILLVPLLLVGFRRGILATCLLCLLPPPGHANVWDDLWQRSDQQAREALREGSPERATELFEDPTWQAVARYRSEDYPGAADAFARQTGPESLYNLGNALARSGDFEAAIAAYDETLASVPDHEDALFNRDLVKQMLDQQQSSEQDSDSEGQEGSNPEDSSQPQDGGNPQDSQNQQADGQQPEQPPEPQDGESDQAQDDSTAEQAETQEGDSSRDERQDALEQWLRRVPDDPGGLLRRKFQYETNQRLRRGDYRSRETEKIW